MPDVEGDKAKRQRLKRHLIGFFYMDIAKVQIAEGKLYLFVGIPSRFWYPVCRFRHAAVTPFCCG